MAFMESIGRGEAPAELAPKTRTQRVNINSTATPNLAPKFKAFGRFRAHSCERTVGSRERTVVDLDESYRR